MRSLRYVFTITASLTVGIAAFLASLALMMMISSTVRSASLTGMLQPGAAAPDFELSDLDGRPVRFSDYRGEPVLVVFWADWRPESKDLVPELNRLHWAGIPVIGINLLEEQERAFRAVNAQNIRYPVVLDADGAVGRAYGVEAVPTIFAVDESGLVVHQGHSSPSAIPEIQNLLGSAVR